MLQDTVYGTPARRKKFAVKRTKGWRDDRGAFVAERKVSADIQFKTQRGRQTNRKIMKHRLEQQTQGVGFLSWHRAQ